MIAKISCPWCGSIQDAAVALHGPKVPPKDGDLLFCVECGEWCEYLAGRLYGPSDATYDAINRDPACHDLRRLWLSKRQDGASRDYDHG